MYTLQQMGDGAVFGTRPEAIEVRPVPCNSLACPHCGLDYSGNTKFDPYQEKDGTKFFCEKCLYRLVLGVNSKNGERWIGLEPVPKGGYMVHYEIREDGLLKSNYFPHKNKGEKLISTEEKAWKLAEKFTKNQSNVVNIYVTYSDYGTVNGYMKKIINEY